MAEDSEELSIRLGFELDEQELKNSIADSKKAIDKDYTKIFKDVGNGAGKRISTGVKEGIKKNRNAVSKAADDNIAKPIGSALKKRLNKAITVALGIGISKAVGKTISLLKNELSAATGRAVQFEKGIAEVNSILDRNEKLTEKSTNALLRFSTQFGTKQQKQVRAFYNIVSAGVKGTSNQLATLNVANKAAVAGLVNIDTAAFAIVSSVNAYASTALTASRASDILFRGVKEGQLVFSDLAASLGRVATIGSQVGLSFAEVIGSLSAITRTGLPAAETASALRQLFSTLLNPSEQAKKVLKELNAEIRNNIKSQIDLGKTSPGQGIKELNKQLIVFSKEGIKAAGGIAPFLSNLTKQIGGNSTALNVLFKNVRAFTAIASATGNIKQFQQILDSVKNSAGATDEAFRILSDTLSFKFGKAMAQLAAIGTVFLSALIDPAKKALDFFLNNFAPAFLTVLDIFNTHFLPGFELVFNVLAGIVKLGVGTIRVGVFGLLTLVSGAISDLLGVIGFLSPGLKQQLSGVKDVLDEAIGNFVEQANAGGEQMTQSFSGVFAGGFTEASVKIKDTLEDILINQDAFTEKMKKKFAEFGNAAKSAGDKVKNELKKQNDALESALASGISTGIQSMVSALANGEDVISAFAKNILGTLGDMAIKVGEVVVATALAELALLESPFAGLALGAGLIAIGAILKQLAGGEGGLGGASASGGGAAAPSIPLDTLPDELEAQELQPQTTVNLNVEGSIFDGDNTARRLADLLNAGFDNENITIKGTT